MNTEASEFDSDIDDKTVEVKRVDTETHTCPRCDHQNTLEQLQHRDYRCGKCNMEMAHLDYGPNDSIRGIFGWLLPVGFVFQDRYQIKQVLGKGGFGATYLVDDLRLSGKRRALKEVPELLFDQYETSLLSRLDHPAIPDIIDHLVAEGMQYLVLKFGGSRTLGSERRSSPNKRIPLNKLLPWMRQLCEVLIYLHSQKPPVIHRDLKPDNILLNEDERIMLIDFGIAKEFSSEHTRTSANAVSESFSSPEQVAGTGTDMRADIYSLGATFYSLLTGKNPPGAFARVSGQELVLPSALVPELPEEVEQAIMKALSLKKEERQQSVVEFAVALDSGDWGATRRLEPDANLQESDEDLPEDGATVVLPSRPKSRPHPPVGTPPPAQLPTQPTANKGKPVWPVAGVVIALAAGGVAYSLLKSPAPKDGPKPAAEIRETAAATAGQSPAVAPTLPADSPVKPEVKAETISTPPPPTSDEQLFVDQMPAVKQGDHDPAAFAPELEKLLDRYLTPINGIPLSLSQQGIYRENDSIKFKLSLDEAAYLHVFILEPNGKATLVYPSQYAKNNRAGPGVVNLPNDKPPILAGPPFGKSWFLAFSTGDANNLYQQFAKDKTRVKGGLLELRIWEVLSFLQDPINKPSTQIVGSVLHICARTGPCP